MTLRKGDKLFKLERREDALERVLSRVKEYLASNPDALTIPEKDLADILCFHESYVIYEVREDVHYRGHKDGYSFAAAVDLKVIY